MEYRRVTIPGGTYFFTLVTHNRQSIFSSPEAIGLLRRSFGYTLERMPFTIVASVVLPDHLHFIWSLPDADSDFSTRWRLIKSHFTKYWHKKEKTNVWQRRFWEHLIRDESDLNRHIEYIHYNPIKHGLVKSANEWAYSSFMKFVRSGLYPVDWGKNDGIWDGQLGME